MQNKNLGDDSHCYRLFQSRNHSGVTTIDSDNNNNNDDDHHHH